MPARMPEREKVIRATARGSRGRHAPTSDPIAPATPEGLTGRAEAAWHALCRDLDLLGLLFACDGQVIKLAAELVADAAALREALADGMTYEARTGAGAVMRRARPECALLDATERRLLATLAQLGLTARSRISLDTTRPAIVTERPNGADAYFA